MRLFGGAVSRSIVGLTALLLAVAALPAVVAPAPAAPVSAASGVQANSVAALGAPALGDLAGRVLNRPLVGMAASPDRVGYWLVASDGGVFTFGDAGFFGSTGAVRLNQPVVGVAADPATGGYWLVAADGGVFAFNAPFFGSLGGIALHKPVVAMASTPDGRGYWLVASDGGVFSFGDAAFHGSLGNVTLDRPVVGMAADASTGGYWLVASDGGVFSFNAPFLGSTGAVHLDEPVVGMAATPDAGGYWLVAADGGVFTFGDAPFEGASIAGSTAPAIGLAAATSGYWVAYGQGFAASGTPPEVPASPGGGPGTFPPTGAGVLSGKIVAIDPGHNGGNGADPSFINAPIWNGRQTEACDTTGTATNGGYTESLFNFNMALYVTADLRAEGATVVMIRTTNTGVGPCVTDRAAIGNNAGADAALSIHADGGPPGGRGFAILEPVADGVNNAIIGPSQVLGADLRDAFGAASGEPISNYDGVNGIQPRDDLGGTNLSTVPKVFIEVANMRNAVDASLLITPASQARAAGAIAAGLATYLTSP
jgi:N-acetylmuramoyl-L-alanine amidase